MSGRSKSTLVIGVLLVFSSLGVIAFGKHDQHELLYVTVKALCGAKQEKPSVQAQTSQFKAEACQIHPCDNGAECERLQDGRRCLCKDGYIGESCQQVDYCKVTHCKNGATCLNSAGGSTCECTSGFYGEFCQNVDYCKSTSCKNGATCLNSAGASTCTCTSGFYGEFCQYVDYCKDTSCKNGATCLNSAGGSTCTCTSGFYGEFCQHVDYCKDTSCKNGATCLNSAEDSTCKCTSGFYGEFCQNVDYCDKVVCKNGALCLNSEIKATCNCSTGFYGDLCQNVDHCQFTPCENGATCLNKARGSKCECAEGFYGNLCQFVKVNPDENLLLGKTTKQSSSFSDVTASAKAVDGNKNGEYEHGSCMHSKKEKFPWWLVDLGSDQCVGMVKIFNVGGKARKRLRGAIVRYGSDPDRLNPVCGVISLNQVKTELEIQISCNLPGRYLTIEIPKKQYLQFCEVQAFAGHCQDSDSNLLLEKTANQSSIYSATMSTPDKAVDGKTDGEYKLGSCMRTQKEVGPWWMVDLGSTQCVGMIHIFNTDGKNGRQLSGAIVRVGPNSNRKKNPICGKISRSKVKAHQKIRIPCNLSGQYLSIEIKSKKEKFLQFCEVQAFQGTCYSKKL